MGDKISVIVPIYNVEQYLRKCIDSIINQTYKNLEIILVDDGSTDASGEICNKYEQQDERIRVIHKKNGGAADARNKGLEVMTGKFVSFVDSDDWIEYNFYENMIEQAIKYNADIVVSNYNYVSDNGDIICRYEKNDKVRYNTEEAMNEMIHDGFIQAVIWNKLYLKSCIKDIRFKVGKICEDEFFTYKIIANAKEVVYNSKPLYFYRKREGSVMDKYKLNRLDGVDAIYERLQFIKNKFPSLYKYEKLTLCNTCIYNYQMILKNHNIDPDNIGRNKLKVYRKNIEFTFKDLEYYTLKDRIKIILSSISLDFYCKFKNKTRWD